MLVQYVRKPGKMVNGVFQKGKPFGCLVSVLQGDTISVGWSLCSPRDEWDRDVAQNIAWARATMCEDLVKKDPTIRLLVPQSLAKEFEEFMFRSMKYFKTADTTLGYAYEYTVANDDVMTIKAVKLF